MDGYIVNMKLENPSVPFEQKVFVCIVDNKVVGNIANFQRFSDENQDLIPVFVPKWETLVKILESPNHKFIENPTGVMVGTIWDGQQFIQPNIEDDPVGSYIENDTDVYIKVNNSYIFYENDMWIAIKDYTFYIIKIIREFLEQNTSLEVNILINPTKTPNFNNNNKIVRIGINYDQTIVSDEIQNLPQEPIAKYPFNNKNYTVKLEMYSYLNNMDIIFEYSKPNIKNLEISGLYPDFLMKMQYISASIYKNVYPESLQKTIETLTLFGGDIPSPRRSQKLLELNNLFINHINENLCFSNDLKTLLQNTKILINIHQSDFENTFEEIRVLPALQQKVLVISEISPLTDLVPFNSLIIWTTYEKIAEKTKEVLDNYDYFYNQIFTQPNIFLLNNLHNQNQIHLQNKISSIINNL